MQKQLGFSVIELMLTLVIAAIILGVGMPAFAHMIKQTSSVAAGNRLTGLINYIRGEAVQKGKIITLCGTEDFRKCMRSRDWGNRLMVFNDHDFDRELDKDEQLLRLFEFEEDSEIRWRSFRNKSYLRFYPAGITYYQNGNFTYCPGNRDPRYARHYILNASGRLYPARKDRNENDIVEDLRGRDIRCD